MQAPPKPDNEAQRLATLRELRILDTPLEDRFDRITRTAQHLFDVPIVLVSLVDENRQWFKSCYGLSVVETPRDISFCGHAILGTDLFVIEDALEDARFADNPLVIGEPKVRFYAGCPLRASNGNVLGTLCVIDSKPHRFGETQRRELRDMGGWAEQELNLMGLQAATARALESEARLSAVLDGVVDGIITIDPIGTIKTFNSAARRIFGYTDEEVIGRNVKILMPDPYQSAHDGYLNNYMTSGVARIIGIGREVEGLRKNGTRFPISLAVAEVALQGQRIFTGIVRDITESKKVERMKNEFISTVSHELRTPLTSIRGSLGLIAGGAVGEIPAQAKALVDIACNNSERLVRLINDILDIEKINSGKLVFDIKPLPLMPIIEQTLIANHAYAAQLDVHFELTETLPEAIVAVDSDRLQQVLTNLLSNAAKYSPKGGTVGLSVVRRDGVVRVAIADQGPGIPEEFQSRIFEKFAQADGSDQRQKGGTGLGLSITKAIVEKHGGIIDYTTRINEGSTFYFELPLLTTLAPQIESLLPAVGAGDQSRILICEDDPDIAQLIAMMLRQQGYVVDIAYSAEQAKAMLADGHYAAMTLDLMLPGQDGISLVRELRASMAYRNLPIIVVSAKADKGKLELNGGAVNMVDWLDKPIDQDRLLRAALRAVRKGSGLPHILHVEDDADVVQVVATILAGQATLVQAETLQAARGLLAIEHFDLVLLDLNLPDGSGMDLLPTINQLVPPPPVAVFSASEINAGILKQVDSALIKSQTSNKLLFDTISSLIRKSTA